MTRRAGLGRLVLPLVLLGFTTACSTTLRKCAQRAGVAAGRASGAPEDTTCDQPPASAEDLAALEELRRRFHDAAAPPPPTFAELAAGEDERFVYEVGQRLEDKVTRRGSRALSPPERVTWMLVELFMEVGNGGLHQYFWNSAGNCAREARGALATVGDVDAVAAFDGALALFPAGGPAEDRETRWEQMDAVPDPLHAWTPFEERTTRAATALATYLRAHAAEVDAPPPPGP